MDNSKTNTIKHIFSATNSSNLNQFTNNQSLYHIQQQQHQQNEFMINNSNRTSNCSINILLNGSGGNNSVNNNSQFIEGIDAIDGIQNNGNYYKFNA